MSVGAITEMGFKFFLCSLFLLFIIHLAFTESLLLPDPKRQQITGVSDQRARPGQLVDLANEENVVGVSISGAVQKP
ncbi:TPA: hypothetical protein DHW51_09605, partial [Candidatus Poribacteria bacterium]|nr:hypothetical protein [Candidatus Poribacteria bacterium]